MNTHKKNILDNLAFGLVSSLETFKGNTITLKNTNLSFEGITIHGDCFTKKIEAITVEKELIKLEIHGMRAINKLFFEQDYWIYFVVVPENIIVCAKGLPFIQKQMKLSKNNAYLKDLKQWMLQTKELSKNTGLQLTLKINVPFSTPLRKIVTEIVEHKSNDWENEIPEIWENKSNWVQIYQSEKYVEI